MAINLSANTVLSIDPRKGSFLDKKGHTVTNTAVTFADSEKGMCGRYSDTSNSALTITDANDLSFGNGSTDSPFSIEVWAKITGTDKLQQFVIKNITNEYQFVKNATNNIRLNCFTSGSIYIGRQGAFTDRAGWHHLVATYSGSGTSAGIKVYVDGVQIDTTNDQNGTYVAMNNSSSNLSIGGGNTDGSIGRTQIFNKVLSQTEINALYKEFLQANNIKKPKRLVKPKPNDLSSERVQVKGTDLILSNDYTNATYWTNYNLTQSGARFTATNATNYLYTSTDSITTVVGQRYRFQFEAKNVTATTVNYAVYNETGAAFIISDTNYVGYLNTTGFTLITVDFIALGTKSRVYPIRNLSNTHAVEIQNVKVYAVGGLIAAYDMTPIGGKLNDISGTGNNSTSIVNAISTQNGMNFASNGYIRATMYGSVLSSKTIFFRFKLNTVSTQCIYSSGTTAGNQSLLISGSVLCHYVYTSSAYGRQVKSTSVLVANTWYNAWLVQDETNTSYKIYINGVDESQASAVTQSVQNVSAVNIGMNNRSGSENYFNGEIALYKQRDRALTATEIKEQNNELISLYGEDFSNNGADGTSICPDGWMVRSGTFGVKEYPKNNTTNLLSTFDFTSSWIAQAGGNVTINDSDTFTTNGAGLYIYRSSFLTTGKMYYAEVDADLPVAVSNGTGSFSAYSTTVRHYFYSANALFNIHKETAGSVTISRIIIRQVQELPAGTKYMECLTSGAITFPQPLAYGTWEFDWYKGNTNNDLHLYLALVLGGTPAMTFRAYTGEDIYMRFNGAGGFQTATSYFINNAWYKTKITRTAAGVTSCYIKGGKFGETYQLVSVSGGGAGANPVTQTNPTSSNTFYADIDQGDCITNIKIYDGIIL